MKKIITTVFVVSCLVALSFLIIKNTNLPAAKKHTESYTDDYLVSLKKEAVEYENKAFELGDIPMKSLIKATGTIINTDSETQPIINKNDRFILELTDGTTRLHVINASQSTPNLEDTVTIYGEYNGLVVANLLEVAAD